jgi:hypothetical protein
MARPTPGLPVSVRLQRHLQVIECRYPRAWEQIDLLRRTYVPVNLWPSWCFVPLARVRDLIGPDESTHDPTRHVDVAIVAGLAAWRGQRTICPSDRVATLIDGPFDLDIPTTQLHAPLERPIYLELPPAALGSHATGPTRGVLVHLAYDERLHQTELRLLIEPTRRWTLGSVPLVPLSVPLTEPTLARSLDAFVREETQRRHRLVRHAVAGELAVALHSLVRVCVGVIVQSPDSHRLTGWTTPASTQSFSTSATP